MARSSKKEADTTEKSASSPNSDPAFILGKYLQNNKEDHYNFTEVIDYKVSSGSLNIDSEIGGFGPGVHRLTGPSGTGKTSSAFKIAEGFMEMTKKIGKKGRVLYVKSEGRLSDEMRKRAGLKFTRNYEEWTDGVVFVFECNIYETIIGLLRSLVGENTEGYLYCFIIDSADAVNLKNDIIKKIEDGNKVAGAPLLTKQFLQKMSLAMTAYGHMCLFLGQVSADIKLNPYEKGAPRPVQGSGGNAIQHFSNQVLEYQTYYEGDLILENEDERMDRIKNKPIGHIAKVKIGKSDKERKYITIAVPIRHEQEGGNSIWREREVVDLLLMWGLIQKKNAWFPFSEVLIKELKENFPDKEDKIPEQIQGLNGIYKFLDNNPDIFNYLYNKFSGMIQGA